MPKFILLFRKLISSIFLLCVTFGASAQSPPTKPNARLLDSLRQRSLRTQQQRIQDPALGRVPTERLDAARQAIASQLTTPQRARQQARTAAPSDWTERGPLGISGTIRALLVDPLDPTQRKVWAGSSTAGLWVNNDITSPDSLWRCLSDSWSSREVMAIAADSANPQVRYVATGDLLSPTDSDNSGIWKSTNGGVSWSKLAPITPNATNGLLLASFQRVGKLVVGRSGVVFAATQNGLVRSADGGVSWQFTLAPQQNIGGQPVTGGDDRITDIERSRDGLLYAATATGRLFRSQTTAGTSWTEVTPPSTLPYSGIRTELALSNTAQGAGQQVIYAINIAFSATYGSYTARWLRRSTNGGQTWQTVTRPTYANYPNDDFTLGFGDNYLTLNVAPDNANTVYLSAYDQLYRSTDGGQSWSGGAPIDRTTALLPIGNQQVVWGGDVAVRHSASLGTLAQQGVNDAQHNRTQGFGGFAGVGLAMRNIHGSVYRLAGGGGEPGLIEMPATGGDGKSVQVSFPAYPLRPFIDQDTPSLQLAMTASDGFLWRNTAVDPTWSYASTTLAAGNSALIDFADYDGRNNMLYFWAGNYLRAHFINNSAPIFSPIATTLTQPSVVKVGAVPNVLVVATVDGKLYRLTGTHEPTVTHTRLDNGAFPVGSTISSVDFGGNDNELIVTLSNYGVKSVWYTADGGTTWISKDEPGYGLPDMPIYQVITRLTNRRQVMLATELGVWTTNNISAPNPNWQLSSTSMPLIRSPRLAYRTSDGRLAVITNGRGIWESSVWAETPPTSPTLLAGRLASTSFCAGSTFPLAFTVNSGNGTTVQARLSDAQGRFANGPIVGSSIDSPLTVTLPANAAYGTGYRLRLEMPDLDLTATISQTLAISDLTGQQALILDRRNAFDVRLRNLPFSDGDICANDTATLFAALTDRPLSASATVRWAVDGVALSGASSATLLTNRTGVYSFTATEFGCTITNSNDFLLKATDTPTASIVNPAAVAGRPDSGPVCAGKRVAILAGYLGKRATYQWLRDGTPIAGATTPTLSASQTGAYTYSVALGTCVATAPPVVLTFGQAILASPIAVLGDMAPTLCGTNPVTLYATRQPDSTAYQWLQNGQPMAGQTGTELTTSQPGNYALQVQRGGCQAVSSPVAVSVGSQLSTGFYFYGSQTACAGEGITLYAKRYDQALQWMRNGVDIPGATDLLYEATTSGSYTLRATAGGCSGTAVAVALVFSQTLAPTLTANERCNSVDLSTQDYPLDGTTQFVWLRNGQPMSSVNQPYRTVSESGTYSLSITNGVCRGVSRPLSITIGQPAKPQIQAIGNAVRCPNSALELQVVKGAFSYWKRNGTAIPNAQGDRYIATESGIYTVAYQEGTCLTESNALTITFSQPTSASLISSRMLLQPGQSGTLVVGLSGQSPWSFTLSNGQAFSNITQNPFVVAVQPGSGTSYSLVGVVNVCGPGTFGGVTRVIVGSADLSLNTWVNKRTTPLNGVIVQTVRVHNNGPDAAEGIVLTNRLPAGISYVGSSTASGGVTSYPVGTLAAGESMTYSIGLRTNRSGTFVNAVEISAADTPDPDSTPDTGTGDGEDDSAQADWSTPDTSTYYAVSPNPNGRVLPAVAPNQPAPIANRADLSLSLWTSRRVAARNVDTVRVMVQVINRGGLATTNVRVGLDFPNGQFSTDGDNWFSTGNAGIRLSVSLGQMSVGQSITRTLYWIPSATGTVLGEITSSSVLDPNSTPNNHATRPGEDDEGTADVRVIR